MLLTRSVDARSTTIKFRAFPERLLINYIYGIFISL